VRAIEGAVFTDPWSARDFRECLASGVPFLVAECDGGVAGYTIAHHAADEGEILNLGVTPPQRRRGVGRALVVGVLEELAAHGVRIVFLEVRESNTAARRLYEAHGFREVGRRAKYYRRPEEDAVVLRTAISAAGGAA
jgi:ribosomal-protein-alanine N-acetyltransferase